MPSLSASVVDTIGCGDAYFALSSARRRSRHAGAGRRARREHRRRRDDAAALQRECGHRAGIPHHREDRHLMRVLVTGGCGYVGTRLTEALLARTVVRGDRRSTRRGSATYLAAASAADGRARRRARRSTRSTSRAIRYDLPPRQHRQRPGGRAQSVRLVGGQRARDDAACARRRAPGRPAVHLRFVGQRSTASPMRRASPKTSTLMPISDYNKTKMVAERVILSYRGSLRDDDRRPGHGLRSVAADAPGPHREPADDAGARERRDDGVRRRAGAAEHPHRRSRRPVPVRDRAAAWRRLQRGRSRTSRSSRSRGTSRRSCRPTIGILPSNDPRSYRLCSDRLLATGFAPHKNVATAVARARRGLSRRAACVTSRHWHNVNWMKTAQPGLTSREQPQDPDSRRRRRRLVDGLLPQREGLRRHRASRRTAVSAAWRARATTAGIRTSSARTSGSGRAARRSRSTHTIVTLTGDELFYIDRRLFT